jgi:hypothetical protein
VKKIQAKTVLVYNIYLGLVFIVLIKKHIGCNFVLDNISVLDHDFSSSIIIELIYDPCSSEGFVAFLFFVSIFQKYTFAIIELVNKNDVFMVLVWC